MTRPAAAALVLLALAAATPLAAAVRTYTSAPAAVIPDAAPPRPGTARSVSDTLTIANRGAILDLDVRVTLRHPGHGDLSLELTAPDGSTTVRLLATEGGPGDGLTNVTFDDEASGLPPGFVVDGICLVDRRYRPDPGSLSAFDGLDVHGTWTLTVSDHFTTDAVDCDCDGQVVGPACPRTLDEWSLIADLGDGGSGGPPTLSCREMLALAGGILVLLVILWLLVSKTRP